MLGDELRQSVRWELCSLAHLAYRTDRYSTLLHWGTAGEAATSAEWGARVAGRAGWGLLTTACIPPSCAVLYKVPCLALLFSAQYPIASQCKTIPYPTNAQAINLS